MALDRTKTITAVTYNGNNFPIRRLLSSKKLSYSMEHT